SPRTRPSPWARAGPSWARARRTSASPSARSTSSNRGRRSGRSAARSAWPTPPCRTAASPPGTRCRSPGGRSWPRWARPRARAPVAALSFDHVKIVGSRSDGIQMSVSQFDAASTDLTIVGAAEYPVRLDPSALGSLPSGSYVGNAHDEILVPGGSVVADMTIHARGVPYHIGDSVASPHLRVPTTPGSPVATLTIEPNVTLRFESDGVLAVEHFTGTNPASGALVARGTAAAPIVFTSA